MPRLVKRVTKSKNMQQLPRLGFLTSFLKRNHFFLAILLSLGYGRIAQGFVAAPHAHSVRCRSQLGADKNEATADNPLPEPSSDTSTFGRQQYWDNLYKDAGDEAFSWYSGWQELAPFFSELIPDSSSRILVPGVGNDGTVVEMYDDGYQCLTVFDYAPEGCNCARRLLGPNRLANTQVLVADARNLPFDSDTFDAALDKGTLDAIYLSGGRSKELSAKHLDMAVAEMGRAICSGGIVVSISAACVDAVQASFDGQPDVWVPVRDGSFYVTSDGYTSNNVDGTLLAWKRK